HRVRAGRCQAEARQRRPRGAGDPGALIRAPGPRRARPRGVESGIMKTLLVTGATAGFGAAIVERFVSAGWRAVATGRRQDRLDALAARLGPDRVHAACFDIRDADAMAAALDTIPAPFRAIDLLVNNAGLALGTAPAQACDLAQWRQMIDTNVTALVTMTHRLLPTLIERRG